MDVACHSGKTCGPCVICNRLSFRHYFHLLDRANNTECFIVIIFKEAKRKTINLVISIVYVIHVKKGINVQ